MQFAVGGGSPGEPPPTADARRPPWGASGSQTDDRPVDDVNANHYRLQMRDQSTPCAPDPDQDGPKAANPPGAGIGRTTSETLLGASGTLEIEHRGRVYRLRITQQGKLILTA